MSDTAPAVVDARMPPDSVLVPPVLPATVNGVTAALGGGTPDGIVLSGVFRVGSIIN